MLSENMTLEIAEKVGAASDIDGAWSVVQDQLFARGFSYAKYGFVSTHPDLIAAGDIIQVGRFCEDWETLFPGAPSIEEDAVIEHCISSALPLTFSELYRRMDAGLLRPKQNRTHAIARGAGMKHGVAFSIPDESILSFGGVSLEGSREFSESEFAEHLNACFPEIRTLSEIFHANVQRPLLLEPSRRPSPRERECLLWITQGLRPQQIAFRLGTHTKTVDKQLQNVRRKLNAKTNAQAAMRAVVMRLIDP